ncbi:MAG: DNA cytosine methyltransferase [bacterium]|nr:DNA cytosine methyltransferase [bacterium]
MQGYYIKKVGQNKGAPRIWLEGSQTVRAGFSAGQRYDIEVQGEMVVLQANKNGSRVVSGKMIGERNNPIIDINSKALLAIFDGMAAIRIVVKKDQIFLLPLASEIKKRERFQRLRGKLERGDPLSIGSVSHGGGILSHAMHAGLKQAGIESHLAFANEIRGELLEHAAIHNDAWSETTQILSTPMQELAFDNRGVASIPKVELLELGLPCSGASRAGKSKRGLVHPEAHPEVGHLVVAALIIVSKSNAAVITLENVPEYASSASADILRNQLRDMGYVTHERILNGKEWGALENRNRWCMVAVSEGIEFNFDQLQPPGADQKLIADVLDNSIGPNDERWRTYSYLKTKELRDAEKGNGFGMQIVSPGENSVPTLRKGYAKGGSTDPLIQHPTNPELLRQFTAEEHARIKGVPESLVDGLSNSVAHQILGQGIVYRPFKDVGAHIGNALNRFAGKDVIDKPVEFEAISFKLNADAPGM